MGWRLLPGSRRFPFVLFSFRHPTATSIILVARPGITFPKYYFSAVYYLTVWLVLSLTDQRTGDDYGPVSATEQ
jgi:hypothetical protein